MRFPRTDFFIAAILGSVVSFRIWGLGIANTDDADWALAAFNVPGNFFTRFPIGPTAESQGRAWFFVSGGFMLHALQWQGSVYGELLRLGGFAGFFAVFHAAARAFCGLRVALLSAAFSAGFLMIRWDGSILVTYPLITWVAGIACGAALLAGRRYVQGGHGAWLAAAGLLLFFSFFNHEGVTALFMVLSLLAAWVQRAAGGQRWKKLMGVTLAACAACAAVYVGWRLAHPTQYDGHAVGPLALRPFLLALGHFSAGGTALHALAFPYEVRYVSAQEGTGVTRFYGLGQDWAGLLESRLAWLAGACTAWLVVRALRRPGAGGDAAHLRRRAVIAGLLVATVVILPVALTGKYQDWALNKGIRAYSHTALAHFGWCLALAGGVAAIDARRRAAIAAVALAAGLLAALATQSNGRIVDDIRTETGRWRVLETLLAVNREGPRAPVLAVPRFADGTWFTVVPPTYWSGYARARHGDATRIALKPEPGAPIADYAYDLRRKQFVGLVAGGGRVWVFADPAGAQVLDVIAVDGEGRTTRHPLGAPRRVGRIAVYEAALPPAARTVRLQGVAPDSGRSVLGVDLQALRTLN